MLDSIKGYPHVYVESYQKLGMVIIQFFIYQINMFKVLYNANNNRLMFQWKVLNYSWEVYKILTVMIFVTTIQ